MSDFCFLILGGLPGSGKSTFAEYLKTDKVQTSEELYIHIEYDRILPQINYALDYEINQVDPRTLWKSYRHLIVKSIKKVIEILESLKRNKSCISNKDLYSALCSDLTIFSTTERDIEMNVIKNICLQLQEDNVFETVVFIIDDNMYYKSMRYVWFQLARQHSCGFSQIFQNVDLETCLLRNDLRKEPVPLDIIRKMSDTMEWPNTQMNHWEQNSLIITSSKNILRQDFADTSNICMEDILSRVDIECIRELIQTMLTNPVLNLDEEMAEECDKDRQVCMKSIIHQSDKILRKLVSSKIKQCQNSDKKQLGQHFNVHKVNILKHLKTGVIVFPQNVVDENGQPIIRNLQEFLESIFSIS